MNPRNRWMVIVSLALGALLGLQPAAANADRLPVLPYAAAGLSRPEAAAILLDRFAHGARPGEVALVAAQGPEHWLQLQLRGTLPEPALNEQLKRFPAATLDLPGFAARYPSGSMVYAHARRFYDLLPPLNTPFDDEWRRRKVDLFRAQQGFIEDKYLYDELAGQKVVRAVYAENQLVEVLTDFWQNHFYVSSRTPRSRLWVILHERDAIRPNVLGRFETMLRASTQHPGMIEYLDNARSALPTDDNTLMHQRIAALRRTSDRSASEAVIAEAQRELAALEAEEQLVIDKKFRPRAGINENFARELMELHTMGVDGGQSQQDVVNVARAFTGWAVMPQGPTPQWFATGLTASSKFGFVQDGAFLFRADWHDALPKTILGTRFPAGAGKEEGDRVLTLLARHPSTAGFIARKLATRFVADEPSDALVDHLATVFRKTDGDLTAMVRAIAESPEFWLAAKQRSKVKSPIHLVASALRATHAEIDDTRPLVEWIARMGQPLYRYLAPTGFPDRGNFWISSGTLLTRTQFALTLGAQRIAGIRFSPETLFAPQPPETLGVALDVATQSVLPARDNRETIDGLMPVVTAPTFSAAPGSAVLAALDTAARTLAPRDLDDAAVAAESAGMAAMAANPGMLAEAPASPPVVPPLGDPAFDGARGYSPIAPAPSYGAAPLPVIGTVPDDPVARMIGLIIASPQFQVR